MKIYSVKINKHGWDEFKGFIVVAKNKQSAIKFLKPRFLQHGKWFNSTNWKDGYTIKAIKPEDYKTDTVILSVYNAG